eukprot:s3599_g3.t1
MPRRSTAPPWYGKFSLLVQLIAKMMDTCTPATYDAMKWKTNPAEFIRVIRTHEVAPAPSPGEAGADNLRHLLYGTVPDVDSPPAPDPAPETPATETWHRRRHPRSGSSASVVEETGTAYWMRKNGTPKRVIDVIHYNQKNRFEVCFQRGHYQVRALHGHSISHVRDDLVLTQLSIEDTPEYGAHGTYYDFYESILRRGLMAGGQQGPSFRRRVHLVEQLPWQGAISGMRSDCDLVIWIRTREAAASGVRFFRSANEVLLTETTIDSA